MSEAGVCVGSNEGAEVQEVAEGWVRRIGRVSFGAEFGTLYFGDVRADRFEPTIGRSKLVLNVQRNAIHEH
jgi:hypothetical protein